MTKTLEIIPLLALPRTGVQHYSYLPPINTAINPGDLVKIPFANGRADGLVLERSNSKYPKLKTIQRLLIKNVASEGDLRWLMEFSNSSNESLSLISKTFISTRRRSATSKISFEGLRETKFKTHCVANEAEIDDFFTKNADGQILALIPEYSYANRIEKICKKANHQYIIYSNKLRESEKKSFFFSLAEGKPCVVIASHRGIFLPFSCLRGIVVWEPALSSHRQWDKHPRYDARIGAYLRARNENIPLVFYSTIPSSDLFAIFPKFYEKTRKTLPPITQINSLQNDHNIFPNEIIQQIDKQLERNRKILIFHDVLGYESTYLCGDCGMILRCDICGSAFQRKNNMLFCNICKHSAGSLRAFCPRCGSPKINALKTGTRALLLLIQHTFPNTTVIRIDREEKKKSLETDISNTQIIVATQKIFSYADILDFGLCYIPNAETLFNSHSHDAQERGIILIYRLLNLLNRDGQSRLVIKTLYGESKIIRALSENKTIDLIKTDLTDRKYLQLPPYSDLYYFEKSFLSSDLAKKEINTVVKKIRVISPKIIAYWQIINKHNSFSGIISLRGNRKDLHIATKLVPNNWNIDPYISLANIRK